MRSVMPEDVNGTATCKNTKAHALVRKSHTNPSAGGENRALGSSKVRAENYYHQLTKHAMDALAVSSMPRGAVIALVPVRAERYERRLNAGERCRPSKTFSSPDRPHLRSRTVQADISSVDPSRRAHYQPSPRAIAPKGSDMQRSTSKDMRHAASMIGSNMRGGAGTFWRP